MWTPNEQNSLWLSWSKTVRSPSVVDRTMGAYAAAMPTGNPLTGLRTLIYSNPGELSGFGNEHARSLEAGHRAQWTPSFFSDLSAYISHYDDVFGVLPDWTITTNLDPACSAALARFGLTTSPTPPPSSLCMTVNRGNRYQVRTRGLELSTEWNPSTTWRLQFNTSRLWMDAGENNSYTANSVIYGNSPHYQSSLRSSYNITQNRQFDLWLRRIGGMDYGGYFSGVTGATPINARTELDLRFAEQVNESLELSLNLQNLLSKNQLQFYPDLIPSLPVVPQRTIYLKALWHGR
jgi:iron complex outermembrane receptor protein